MVVWYKKGDKVKLNWDKIKKERSYFSYKSLRETYPTNGEVIKESKTPRTSVKVHFEGTSKVEWVTPDLLLPGDTEIEDMFDKILEGI